jgi:hypothetical protein
MAQHTTKILQEHEKKVVFAYNMFVTKKIKKIASSRRPDHFRTHTKKDGQKYSDFVLKLNAMTTACVISKN